MCLPPNLGGPGPFLSEFTYSQDPLQATPILNDSFPSFLLQEAFPDVPQPGRAYPTLTVPILKLPAPSVSQNPTGSSYHCHFTVKKQRGSEVYFGSNVPPPSLCSEKKPVGEESRRADSVYC